MGSDEEKKEIVVNAPSRPVVSFEKKAEKTAVKALEEERYNVLYINRKVGKYLGICSVCVGAILLISLVYAAIVAQSNLALLAFAASPAVMGLWVIVGLVSIVVGFLLMGSE